MPIGDDNSAEPAGPASNADKLDGHELNELDSQAHTGPNLPKASGGTAPEDNALKTPPDLRDAVEPRSPLAGSEPRTGN